MQLSFTFRHMEASEAIKDYAREKVERIKKYFPDPIMAHVVLSTERGYQHVADVNIQLHNGILIKGTETTEDMYSSIDLVMAKIERQVRRYKEKIRHHKARADLSEIPIAYHVIQAEALDLAPPVAAETRGPTQRALRAAAATIAPPEPPAEPERTGPTVIRTQKFPARAMTVEEAVMQMDLLENSFLVFRSSETGQVSVVYRRSDGNYGLIEPSPVTG
jgi:putative sigma-54 modulation protein